MSAAPASKVLGGNGVAVDAKVVIVPAKRKATYDVPVESDREKPRRLVGSVGTSQVSLTSTWPNQTHSLTFPRTIEAVNALRALADVLLDELVEQGVKE